jgi:hypothetical protein
MIPSIGEDHACRPLMRAGRKGCPMRWVIYALAVSMLAPPALAADVDVLRGSEAVVPALPVGYPTFTRWSGFYAGGQLSYGDAEVNFSRATAPIVGFSLRNTQVEQQAAPSQWQVLGRDANNAFGGGGFLGYNTQWQDLCWRTRGIVVVSEFRPDCRGCVRPLCTRTYAQRG